MQRNLGYFHYPYGFKIFKNGDIQSGKKIRTNIFEAKKADLVEYGSFRRSGLKSSTSNPYLCVIHSSKGLKIDLFGGIGLYKHTSINVVYDKDVFDKLLNFSSYL